jgi:hypothetical protein
VSMKFDDKFMNFYRIMLLVYRGFRVRGLKLG